MNTCHDNPRLANPLRRGTVAAKAHADQRRILATSVAGICILLFASRMAVSQDAPVIQPMGQLQANTTDQWYLILFEDKRVGYERITEARAVEIDNVPSEGNSNASQGKATAAATPSGNMAAQIRRTRDTRLNLKRFGTDLSVSAFQETLESQQGLIIEWSLRRSAADGGSVERSGRWLSEDAVYEVSELAQATRRTYRMATSPQARSSVMTAWIPTALSNNQVQDSFAVLFPETAAVVEVQAKQRADQLIRIQNGKSISVRRIEFWPVIDPTRKTTLYVDDSNIVVRSEQPLLGSTLVMEKCDAATALGTGGMESLDVDLASVVPVDRPISNPEQRQETKLRMTVPSPGQLQLPESNHQKVQRNAANQLTVSLTKPRPEINDQPASRQTPHSPPSRYLKSTQLLDTGDYEVQRLARSAAGISSEPAEICRQMTRYLAANLKRSAFSTTLIAASQTAKQMRGDCTEHAILLAAMMRCYQVPSRVAVGLVYHERVSGFVAHMWTEAYVQGKWLPFDSTMGSSAAAPIIIKVLDSDLAEEASANAVIFLPMLDIIGRARITVLSEAGF